MDLKQYKYLGVANLNDPMEDNEFNRTIESCIEREHITKQIDNSLFPNRKPEVIVICDKCQYYYKKDESD